MATLLANRVQSAHSRTAYRTSTDHRDSRMKQRPLTSFDRRQSISDLFDEAALKTLQSSNLSPPTSIVRRSRPKTTSLGALTHTRPTSTRKLRSDEIESLLESLNRNDTYIVKVDCIADYRTLVQTLDLRRTPLDCHILCALQQRENQIIQQNALRDKRFRSLRDVLEPLHGRDNDNLDLNDDSRTAVSDYPPSDLSYDYLK